MPKRLELFPFRFRDKRTGKWRRARYLAERHELEQRYAEWEIIGEPEIREVGEGGVDPGEIAALDGGAFGGLWKRTGQTFTVWTEPKDGAPPTCPFFSVIFAPQGSHFYTDRAAECATLNQNAGWQYEAIAFYLQLNHSALLTRRGLCRLRWHGSRASSATSEAERDLAAWYARRAVSMCARKPSGGARSGSGNQERMTDSGSKRSA